MSRRLKSISAIVNESAYDSTTHGIPHMFKREHAFLKLFWLVCFVTSACACAYTISKSISSYMQHETVSKVETVLEVPTLFPTISICNLNPFTTEEAFLSNKMFLSQNNISNVDDILATSSSSYLMLRYLIGSNLRKSTFTDKMRKQMGLNLKEMILDCSYNQAPCSADDFEWYFDTLYG